VGTVRTKTDILAYKVRNQNIHSFDKKCESHQYLNMGPSFKVRVEFCINIQKQCFIYFITLFILLNIINYHGFLLRKG